MAKSKHASAKEVLPDILAFDLPTAVTSEGSRVIVVVKTSNCADAGVSVGLFRMLESQRTSRICHNVQDQADPCLHFSCLAMK